MANLSKFTGADLQIALEQLILDKRITVAQIRDAVQRARKIVKLERQIEALRLGAPARKKIKRRKNRKAKKKTGKRKGRKKTKTTGKKKTKKRKKAKVTAKSKAARVMQGRYLGRLNKLKGRDRAKVKALAQNEGTAAAVKLANRLLAA